MSRLWPLACLLGGLASSAAALDLVVPGTLTTRDTSPMAVHQLAMGPATHGQVPLEIHEGPRSTFVWQIPEAASTLALFAPLRDQILGEGFAPVFGCETRGCGGYDFRFGIEVLPAPAMFVDLADFHYMSAVRDDGALSLLVSKAAGQFYVQLTLMGGPEEIIPLVAAEPVITKSTRLELSELGQILRDEGVAVLSDVAFEQGSAELAGDAFTSLTALAELLEAEPAYTVALVGHTDAQGSLTANVALSERRAQSVRRYLIDTYDANPDQIQATGIGYLSPRASNLTDSGRAENRRVEVMLMQD